MRPIVPFGVLLFLAVVPACRMIDQRTFEVSGKAPQAAQLASTGLSEAARPLVTIAFPDLPPDWQASVLAAVHAAQARRPDAAFDVVTPVPLSSSLVLQQQALISGAQDAQAVAAVLLGDGIDAAHIHLGSRGDQGQPAREVRIFVR